MWARLHANYHYEKKLFYDLSSVSDSPWSCVYVKGKKDIISYVGYCIRPKYLIYGPSMGPGSVPSTIKGQGPGINGSQSKIVGKTQYSM